MSPILLLTNQCFVDNTYVTVTATALSWHPAVFLNNGILLRIAMLEITIPVT